MFCFLDNSKGCKASEKNVIAVALVSSTKDTFNTVLNLSGHVNELSLGVLEMFGHTLRYSLRCILKENIF